MKIENSFGVKEEVRGVKITNISFDPNLKGVRITYSTVTKDGSTIGKRRTKYFKHSEALQSGLLHIEKLLSKVIRTVGSL